MTARYSFVGTVALVCTVASSAFAGWGPDGATIKNTTNHIPEVAAASDGAYGSFVVWQEESAPNVGVLRAQHVLPTGDVVPSWPAAGMVVCDVAASRPEVGIVADDLGGAYAWWKEGAAIYLSRFEASGAIAAGWPSRGRMLGSTWPASARPSVIPDGAHGIYLGWPSQGVAMPDANSVLLVHLGPANTGAGGWPNSVRAASSGDPVATIEYWPRLALAADGGVFVAFAQESGDEEVVPSAFRLRRLTSAGLNATSWPAEGLNLGTFHGELLGPDPQTGLLGLAEDGAGGVFALCGFVTDGGSGWMPLDSRLFRKLGDGTDTPGWPAAGLAVNSYAYWEAGPDASLRVLPDGLGGALVGHPQFFDHGTGYDVAATLPEGGWKPASTAYGTANGTEVVTNARGGVFLAGYWPDGPNHMFDSSAFLQVTQSLAAPGWSDFFEWHSDPVVLWYGDVGLAETGDGGAFFFWSQEREKFGLFARRFNGAGEVTAVPPGAEVAALSLGRLKFVAGEGVRASFAIPSGREASLDVFDVGGRRVASSRIVAGAREAVVPGTSRLPSGLYFARLASANQAASGKVLVAR